MLVLFEQIKHGLEYIKTEVKDATLDSKGVYEMYYAYEEPIKNIKLHRILAINRGESEKVLKVAIVEDVAFVVGYIYKDVVKNPQSITAEQVSLAIDDAYKRLIKSSIEREIRSDLKEQAENQAIHIFGENLRNYLLQPPMKGKVVLGVDPAFRTGCKLAVVDATGKFLDKGVMYPHQKNKDEEDTTHIHNSVFSYTCGCCNNMDSSRWRICKRNDNG